MSFVPLEEPLKFIHKKFVSLDRLEVKEVRPLVSRTVSSLAAYMKEDEMFSKLFSRLYYGGSFYHNLKIRSADEFDIDFLCTLPVCRTCAIRSCRCIDIAPARVPGFFRFKVTKSFSPLFYKKFCRDGYVLSSLVYNWTKSLLCKALHRFKEDHVGTNIEISLYTECAPALKICIKRGSRSIYVDLAIAFRLEPYFWPCSEAGYRSNPTPEACFSIVPFALEGSMIHWRPSFQQQEKLVIASKERLKPALRLLKMMKTNLCHTVTSYVLKTLILQQADQRDWKHVSLADAFMTLLQDYVSCLQKKRVAYYWNDKVNLLDYMKTDTLINHYNQVDKLYLKILCEYKTNPGIVAEAIMRKPFDYQMFCNMSTKQHDDHKQSLRNGVIKKIIKQLVL